MGVICVDVVLVVMDDDKINIFGVVCVKFMGCKLVVVLINDLIFVLLMIFLGIDVYINLWVMIVLLILCYICYGCVCDVYLLGDVEVEIIEVEVFLIFFIVGK